MWTRRALLATSAAALCIVLAHGCGTSNPCDGVKCAAGQACNSKSGACVAVVADVGSASLDGGGSDGGAPSGLDAGSGALDAAVETDAAMPADASAPACNPPCTTVAPLCDPTTLSCKVCMSSEGCSGGNPVCDTTKAAGKGECVVCTTLLGCADKPATPVCNTAVSGGWCVQCVQDSQCAAQQICDLQEFICIPEPPDAAMIEPDASAPGLDASEADLDAGAGWDGGSSVGDGGLPCINRGDAGAASCTTNCNDGFHCVGGVCVLNGGNGPVQVTLRWDQPEDLDLHVIEPLTAGYCEIWYGDPNRTGQPSTCGARGSLDLDSNAGCSIDNVDIENVIYPPGAAPHGTYTVRVDYYANCFATGTVPYEVTVRANGTTNVFCGSFPYSASDNGGAGSGVTITTFTVP